MKRAARVVLCAALCFLGAGSAAQAELLVSQTDISGGLLRVAGAPPGGFPDPATGGFAGANSFVLTSPIANNTVLHMQLFVGLAGSGVVSHDQVWIRETGNYLNGGYAYTEFDGSCLPTIAPSTPRIVNCDILVRVGLAAGKSYDLVYENEAFDTEPAPLTYVNGAGQAYMVLSTNALGLPIFVPCIVNDPNTIGAVPPYCTVEQPTNAVGRMVSAAFYGTYPDTSHPIHTTSSYDPWFVSSDPNVGANWVSQSTYSLPFIPPDFSDVRTYPMWIGYAPSGVPLEYAKIQWFSQFDAQGQPVPPAAKRPVVIIPGIMGTELHRKDPPKNTVWLDEPSLTVEPTDYFLFPLVLKTSKSTGQLVTSPDTNNRCAVDREVCTSNSACEFDGLCVAGGTSISSGDPLKIVGYAKYDDLATFLASTGLYTRGTNLFLHGYDWRLDLKGQAETLCASLHAQFFDAQSPNLADKIDIIAHSQGGLVIRAYLQQCADAGRIANVIYLGTPQRGAPLAYAKLIGATNLVDKALGKNSALDYLLNFDTESFLIQNFPAAYALLPRFDFVYLSSGFEPFLTSFQELCDPARAKFSALCNSDLVDQANQLHASQLAGPTLLPRPFAINGSGHYTLLGLDYGDPTCSGPKIIAEAGDGVVPETSSGGFLDPFAYYYVQELHGDLPGNPSVMQQILNILVGNESDPVSGISRTPVGAGVGFRVFTCSPIRIQITDESGNTNGLDSDGNLHQEIPSSSHFVFLENEGGLLPSGKTYLVNVAATGNGLFTLGFDHILPPNYAIVTFAKYSDIPISINSRARLTLGPTNSVPVLELDIDGDGVVDFVIPANAPPTANLFPAVLINVVQNFGLPRGTSQSLLAELAAASASISRGNPNAARGQLGAFINEVSAQRGKGLTITQADTLTAMATRALNAL